MALIFGLLFLIDYNYYASIYFFGLLAPYLERLCNLSATPAVSKAPRTTVYRTPGRSFTRPPRIKTILCSCKLCPSPGIYAITSIPFVNRTFATFRRAEFGFLGVVVYTRVQTPLFCGQESKARDLLAMLIFFLPFFTNWFIVGILSSGSYSQYFTSFKDAMRPLKRLQR